MTGVADRNQIRKTVRVIFFSQTMLIILLSSVLLMTFLSPNFLTLRNLFNIVRQVAVLGIMAIGMTYVIIGKGIDLSISGMLSLCAIVGMKMQNYGFGAVLVGAIFVGTLCGLLNGYLVGKVKANPIIVTLGTSLVFVSLALIYSKGRSIINRTERIYSFFGNENVLGIPVVLLLIIALFLVAGIYLSRSIYARRLYAVGLNERAALASGIDSSKIVWISYVVQGLFVALASLVYTSRLNTVRVNIITPYVFDVITIVVLGGTTLSGGYGSLYKTFIGLILFGVIQNAMGLMAIPYEFQQMIKGIVLICAVVYDEFSRKRRMSE